MNAMKVINVALVVGPCDKLCLAPSAMLLHADEPEPARRISKTQVRKQSCYLFARKLKDSSPFNSSPSDIQPLEAPATMRRSSNSRRRTPV